MFYDSVILPSFISHVTLYSGFSSVTTVVAVTSSPPPVTAVIADLLSPSSNFSLIPNHGRRFSSSALQLCVCSARAHKSREMMWVGKSDRQYKEKKKKRKKVISLIKTYVKGLVIVCILPVSRVRDSVNPFVFLLLLFVSKLDERIV